MKKTLLFLIVLLTLGLNQLYAYELGSYYNNKDIPFIFTQVQDGTYDVYLNMPDVGIKKVWIYHTKPADLSSMDVIYQNKNIIQSSFFYLDRKFSIEVIYFHKLTGEISPIYENTLESLFPPQLAIMAWRDDPKTKLVILQPVFKSQPKVWILIPRRYGLSFPGFVGAESTFLPNGNLRLVLDAGFGKNIQTLVEKKVEIVPIDYTVFEKPVKKPTCYIIPPDHKMRLCTETEAAIRSSSLKTFLGETS